jgi:hypothetical protein
MLVRMMDRSKCKENQIAGKNHDIKITNRYFKI